MKLTTSSIVLAVVLGTASFAAANDTDTVNNGSKREQALEHFKGKTETIRTPTIFVNKEKGSREFCVPVTNGVHGECQIVGETSTRRRRHLQDIKTVTRANEAVLPYPAQGMELVKPGGAISFQENTTLADIECFYFDKQNTNENANVISTCTDITQDVDAGVASVEMQLGVGEWTWWGEDKDGTKTTPQTFTLLAQSIERQSNAVMRNGFGDDNAKEMVSEADWEEESDIKSASGRIYYSSYGVDFACSGTVIKDNRSGKSLIMTAAHCVWDDIDEVFGSNAIFVPNRDAIESELTGEEIHRQCEEDVCGCWTLSAGFVHDKWKTEPWPARLAYDWGLWVVDDVGAHEGNDCGSDALDEAVTPIEFDVTAVKSGLEDSFVTGLGYPLDFNPDFRYCADTATMNQPTDGVDTYWLPGCGLSGGASGGPWMSGEGKIVSVNSWSYSDDLGMGGPIIHESEARCLINAALNADFEAIEARADGEEGEFVECYDRDCVSAGGEIARKLRGGRKLCKGKDAN